MQVQPPVTRRETSVHRVLRLVTRFAPVAVVVVIVTALIASGELKHLSLAQLHASHEVLSAYGKAHPVLMLLAYAGVYIAAVSLSLPAPLIMTLSGGFLFGPLVGGVAACVSSTLGACVAFLIARLTIGDALERGVSPRIRALEAGFKKDAFFYLLTLRLMPVMPFWLINVAAGLLSIRLRTFFAATLIGILPVSLIYAGIGSGLDKVFVQGVPTARSLITPAFALPLLGLALLSVLPILYHRYRARRASVAAGTGAR